MAHEILSVKLYELDKKIGHVHTRIQMSESASHEQIRAEAEALRNECRENELTLRNKLQFSKAGAVTRLSEAYSEVEKIIQRVKEQSGNSSLSNWKNELCVEDKILLAEYALDFAMQAANHALLISLEAIDAQMTQQEREEKNL